MEDWNLRIGLIGGQVAVILPPELVRRFSFSFGGRIVLDPPEARELSRLLGDFADRAEGIARPPAEDAPDAPPQDDGIRRDDYTDGIVFPYQWKGED